MWFNRNSVIGEKDDLTCAKSMQFVGEETNMILSHQSNGNLSERKGGVEGFKVFQVVNQSAQRAFSLFEILIAIGIAAAMMTLLITTFVDQAENAKVDQASMQLAQISQSLQLFRMHVGRYPTAEEGLDVLVNNTANLPNWKGPYLSQDKLQDPWTMKIDYTIQGGKFRLASAGKDNTLGTESDIVYPKEEATNKQGT